MSFQSTTKDSAKFKAVMLPTDVVDTIGSFSLTHFSDSYRHHMSIISGLIHCPMMRCGSFIKLLAEQKEIIKPLAEEARNLDKDGKQLLAEVKEILSQEREASLALLATSKVTLFINDLEAVTRPLLELQRKAAERWLGTVYDGDRLSSPQKYQAAADHERQCRELELWFGQFRVNPVVISRPIDGNRFVAELSVSPIIEAKLSDSGYFIHMDSSHLSAVCALVISALGRAASDVKHGALNDSLLITRIMDGTNTANIRNDAEGNTIGLAVRHVFFDDLLIRCGVTEGDLLKFEYDAPSCLHEIWDGQMAQLKTALAPVKSILSPYGGQMKVIHDSGHEIISVNLTLPMIKDQSASSEANLIEEYSDLWNSRWKETFEQKKVWFQHKFKLNNDESKIIIVHLPGAGLLTPLAQKQLLKILKQAESYVSCIPSINSLHISAEGFAEHFTQACETGGVHINLECSEGSPTESISLRPKQRLRFTDKFFFDRSIYNSIKSLSERATIIDLSCENKDERDYMGGEEHEQQLVKAMIAGLPEAVDAIAQQSNPQDLRVMVTARHGQLEVLFGSKDDVFSLEIRDSQDQLIGVGKFSRHYKTWKTRLLALDLNDRLTKIVKDILNESPPAELNSSKVLKLLSQKNVILSEKLVQDLISAAQGRQIDDSLFDVVSADAILEQALHNPYADINEVSGTIILSENTPDIPKKSYGTYFLKHVDGSSLPQDVFSFVVAKRYYDRGNNDFEPNNNFRQKLKEEETDG